MPSIQRNLTQAFISPSYLNFNIQKQPAAKQLKTNQNNYKLEKGFN